MVHNIKKVSKKKILPRGIHKIEDWVRESMKHSLEFKTTDLTDISEIKKCVNAIGQYNNFDPYKVNKIIDEIKGDVSSIQVGREYSPVLYIEFPYWTSQYMLNPTSNQHTIISSEETRQNMKRAIEIFKKEGLGDEVDEVRSNTIRVWWD